jgi:hypothetical protein
MSLNANERKSTVEVCVMSKRKRWVRGGVLMLAALVIALGLVACGDDDDDDGGDGGGGGSKIALLLPESKTTRYNAHDKPEFEAAEGGARLRADYSNATRRREAASQMEAALTDGAEAVVLDPVTGVSRLWSTWRSSRTFRS